VAVRDLELVHLDQTKTALKDIKILALKLR